MSAPAQPRDAAGRFASYDPWQEVPPIPVPQRADLLPGWEDPEQPGRTLLRVHRCPHGHFSRPGGAGRGCRSCGR